MMRMDHGISVLHPSFGVRAFCPSLEASVINYMALHSVPNRPDVLAFFEPQASGAVQPERDCKVISLGLSTLLNPLFSISF
jgi:hypothetical protein